jgi:hypothetical protein
MGNRIYIIIVGMKEDCKYWKDRGRNGIRLIFICYPMKLMSYMSYSRKNIGKGIKVVVIKKIEIK